MDTTEELRYECFVQTQEGSSACAIALELFVTQVLNDSQIVLFFEHTYLVCYLHPPSKQFHDILIYLIDLHAPRDQLFVLFLGLAVWDTQVPEYLSKNGGRYLLACIA